MGIGTQPSAVSNGSGDGGEDDLLRLVHNPVLPQALQTRLMAAASSPSIPTPMAPPPLNPYQQAAAAADAVGTTTTRGGEHPATDGDDEEDALMHSIVMDTFVRIVRFAAERQGLRDRRDPEDPYDSYPSQDEYDLSGYT